MSAISEKEVIAENLRVLRARKGVSQAKVGASIGMTAGAIANFEHARGNISYAAACGLADFYGVTLNDLRKPKGV